MAKYYINNFNTDGGTYPYKTVENGAKNFHTLLNSENKIELNHGDEILLYNPCPSSTCVIDDSAYPINIYKKIVISPNVDNNGVILKLHGDGNGINLSNKASGTEIKGFTLTKETDTGGSYIYAEDICNLVIHDLNIISSDDIVAGSLGIHLNNCHSSSIYNCIIVPPADYVTVSLGAGYGIKLVNCTNINIYDNFFDHKYRGASTGIEVRNDLIDAYNIYISGNIFVNLGFGSFGITGYGRCTKIVIEYNVIRISGDACSGILMALQDNNSDFYSLFINNNIITFEDDLIAFSMYLGEASLGTSALKCKLVNNIFYNKPESVTCFGPDVEFHSNSIVENNLFYKITNMLTGNTEMGVYYTFDPILKYEYDGSFDVSAIEGYSVSSSSQCLGLGYNFEDIGIYNYDSDKDDVYCNVIDSVTNEINIRTEIDGLKNSFFNCVFIESIDSINSLYGKHYFNGDIYNNQFDWVTTATADFPFTYDNSLYDKELIYVIANKNILLPFNNISSPPNPGIGYDEYIGYETGLFGNSRAGYGTE